MRKKVINKIKFGINIIKVYKTWVKGFLDYFGVFGKNKIKIHKLRNGGKYFFRTGTSDFGIINEIYVVREYHKLIKYIKDNSVVIDIGSQIGVFSVFAAKLGKNVRVYSYEPFKENYEMFQKNITINNLQDNIKSFQLGIAGKKGGRELLIAEDNTGGHSFYGEGKRKIFFKKNNKKIKINTITLKDIFIENKIEECDFLKMDCEGAEYEIIYNTPLKYLKKIKTISMEFHENQDILKLKIFLEKKGFNVKLNKLGEGMLYAWRV